MIDEARLQELRNMVYKDARQTKPPPSHWEIHQECFDTIEALWRVVRAAQAGSPRGSKPMDDALAPFR